jgi:hypothetical protein
LDGIVAGKKLEFNHPMISILTTGAIVDNIFYSIASAQFGSIDKEGK